MSKSHSFIELSTFGIANKDAKQEPSDKLYSHMLFRGKPQDRINETAILLGNQILKGVENDVKNILALISKYPKVLHCTVTATDPLGRQVKGTLLQIAAMAGDLRRGLVEQLITIGKISPEHVAEQLKCITSSEAQEINKQRNQQMLTTIIKFGKDLIKSEAKGSFTDYQKRCQPLIQQLKKNLQPDTKTVITQGFIYDLNILHDATKWLEDNIDRMDEWETHQSTIFCINGIGKLQNLLSYADAREIRNHSIDVRKPPIRTGHLLGVDFYLGYGGEPRTFFDDRLPAAHLNKLTLIKRQSITNLTQHQEGSRTLTK